MLQEQQGPIVDARRASAESTVVAQGVAFVLDVALLLLPLHANRRIGQHVVEGPFLAVGSTVKAILGERVTHDDVVGVLAFDKHV